MRNSRVTRVTIVTTETSTFFLGPEDPDGKRTVEVGTSRWSEKAKIGVLERGRPMEFLYQGAQGRSSVVTNITLV